PRSTRPGDVHARAPPRRPRGRSGLPQPVSAVRSRVRSRLDSWAATLAFASDEPLKARILAPGGTDRPAAARAPRRLAAARRRAGDPARRPRHLPAGLR